MCDICDRRHREKMIEELGSKRIKVMLDNARRITPQQIGTWAYRQGATDMASAIIDNEKNQYIDYQI